MAFGDADASTPAFVNVNSNWTTTGGTSGSFTPPADSLVRLAVFGDTSSGANPGNETVTDSVGGATGWTFRIRRAKPDSGSQAGCVALWEKYFAASPGAITVTVIGNATGASSGGFSTKVVAGCTATAGWVEGSNTAAVMSIVETTANANVRVEMAGTDWNVQAAPTAGAGQTAVLSSAVGAGPDTRVYVGVQNAVTAVAGTAVTMSTASPSSGNANNFIAWELVPSAGGATNLNVGSGAVTVAAAGVTVSASPAAGSGAVAVAGGAVTLSARPAAGSGAVATAAGSITAASSLSSGSGAVAVGASNITVTSGSTLQAGGAAAAVAAAGVTLNALPAPGGAASSVTASSIGLTSSLAVGVGAVAVGASSITVASSRSTGFAAVTVGASDIVLTAAGATSLSVGNAMIAVGAFDIALSGGTVVTTQTGSWQHLADILSEIRQNYAEQISAPPVACPLCGEPLETARGVLHCRFDGWTATDVTL